ncbi:TerC family protein [Vibrio sp.]|nr:TerC family protein [Vibrio sp.]
MLELFLQPETWAIFATLLMLEVILGVDNIVFISILCERVDENRRKFARNLGISLAVFSRIALLLSISWVMTLTEPLVGFAGFTFTGRDLIMLFGGGFLIVKSAMELKEWLGGEEEETHNKKGAKAAFMLIIAQIIAVDVVFSLDSVITAVGLTNDVPIMIAAILGSAVIMVLAAETVNNAVMKFPGLKTLALMFLLLLGGLLIAEGFHLPVNKGYVYFAMVFGLVLEGCQILMRRNRKMLAE